MQFISPKDSTKTLSLGNKKLSSDSNRFSEEFIFQCQPSNTLDFTAQDLQLTKSACFFATPELGESDKIYLTSSVVVKSCLFGIFSGKSKVWERKILVLEQTFIHIQGIGKKTEDRLWNRGFHTWQDFVDHRGTIFSDSRDRIVRQELEASMEHRTNIRFFAERLSSGDMWRIFDAFKTKAVYLDIETSGGYQGMDEITVIGLYNGDTVETFVNGIDLDEFELAIAKYDLVITFSGSSFDLPFIRRWFPSVSLPLAHIDLRFLLKRLGYSGGLKKIEKELGVVRNAEIDGMNGFEAVMLWKAYQWGDRDALETLIQYNTADIVNLEYLMEIGYRKMKERALSGLQY